MTKHIVIVGGGFAGITAARELSKDARFQITLISDRADFEYHAALYRSATGRSPLQVCVPLQEIFAGSDVDVVQATVAKIDAKKRKITCTDKTSYGYDELILAVGMVTSYFGIQGLHEYSFNIQTMDEALRLKDHLHAELTSGHKPDLNYVVVGAGPSGIELAAEMVGYLNRLRKNHRIRKPFHIDLIEAAPRILPALPEQFAARIAARLKRLGVTIYTSTAVGGESADTLQLPHGTIDTHTVIWTAGITNDSLFAAHPKLFTLGKAGKVTVDEHLSAGDHLWVAGDSALTARTGWAQTAVYDGVYIASVLKAQANNKELPSYTPPTPIGAIPVGPNWCAVNMRGFQFYGYIGWVVRRWNDLKLYRTVMPLRLALRSWIMGARRDEHCKSCR